MWKDEVDGRELLIVVVYIVTKTTPIRWSLSHGNFLLALEHKLIPVFI